MLPPLPRHFPEEPFFCHHLGICLAQGKSFFAWPVKRKCRVLLIDGEMPSAALQKRFRLMAGKDLPENLDLLPSEALWNAGEPLNLNDAATQVRVQQMLDALVSKGKKPDLTIFDNLSSLTSGKDENSNGELDSLLQWLMTLRHQGYAVLLVHHAGRSGDQRGATRREDLLDTSIMLEEVKNQTAPIRGACFTITFTKTRELEPTPRTLSVNLSTDNDVAIWKTLQTVSDEVLVLQTIRDHAPKSQTALADLLGCVKTTAGKRLKPLIAKGLVQQTSKLISLTANGLAASQGTQNPTPPLTAKARKYA